MLYKYLATFWIIFGRFVNAQKMKNSIAIWSHCCQRAQLLMGMRSNQLSAWRLVFVEPVPHGVLSIAQASARDWTKLSIERIKVA